MPTKTNKPAKIQFTDIQWVINNLTDKDLDAVDAMNIDSLHIDNFMSEQIESGGQFSFKYDHYSECPQLSLMYLEKNNHHTGFALSARGSDFNHCIKILMYKFFEVAKGDLTNLSEVKRSTRKYG